MFRMLQKRNILVQIISFVSFIQAGCSRTYVSNPWARGSLTSLNYSHSISSLSFHLFQLNYLEKQKMIRITYAPAKLKWCHMLILTFDFFKGFLLGYSGGYRGPRPGSAPCSCKNLSFFVFFHTQFQFQLFSEHTL